MSKNKVWYDGHVRQRNMPKKRSKGEILMRGDMWHEGAHPQIDVKVYDNFEPVIERVMTEFHVSDDVARDAVQTAFEVACMDFWGYWQQEWKTDDDPYGYYFPGHDISIECEGRSGGHLVVKGLPEVASWDAVMVARWWRFVDAVSQDIEYRISADALIECIESNDYACPIPAGLVEVA